MIFQKITVFESNSPLSQWDSLCFIFQSVVILTEFIEKLKQDSHWMTVSV